MEKISNEFTEVIAVLDAQRQQLNRLFEDYSGDAIIRLELLNARRELSGVISRIERVEINKFVTDSKKGN